MKPFALAGIYAASLGAVVLAIEQAYVDESSAGMLLVGWAFAGLVIVVIGVLRRE